MGYLFISYISVFSSLIGVVILLFIVWIILKYIKLKKQEKNRLFNLNSFFDRLPQPYIKIKFLLNENGVVENYIITDLNIQFEKEFGFEKDKTIGKNGVEMGRIKNLEDVTKLQNVYNNRQVYSREYYHKETNKHYEVIHYCFEDEKNAYAFFIDRTKEHLIKEHNEELKSLLNSIIKNLPIPFCVKKVGDDEHYILWNKKAEDFFGKTADEVIGKNDIDVFGEEYATTIHEKEKDLIKNGGISNYEERVSFNNNSRISSVIKSLTKRENKPSYLVTTRWDITEHKEIQDLLKLKNQKLALALSAGHIIPLSWDITNNLFTINYDELNIGNENVNKRVLKTSEYMFSILHPLDVDQMKTICRDISEGKSDNFEICIRTNLRNADYEWFNIKAWVSEKDIKGNAITVTGIAINISKTKQIEKTLVDAKEKAEEANKLKSAFLANISHEVRTPLNAILGFSKILATTEMDEYQKKQFADIVEHNNNSLLRIFNDLIYLSDINAGTLDRKYSDVDINALITETIQTARYIAKEKNIEIILEDRLSDCIFKTERSWITQVISNLISNAIKFTDEGRITLGYKLKKEGIYIYVKDTGNGIPADKQALVFNKFSKLDLFKQGAGLGLAVCRGIIDNLGGNIGVESEIGIGSTFWFTLPFIQDMALNSAIQTKEL